MTQKQRTKKKGRRVSKRKVIRLIVVLIIMIGVPIMWVRHCNSENYQKTLAQNPEEVLPHINDSLKNDRSVFDGSARMDSMITKYLKRWEINGAQLAVSRNDSLVYAKGYGWAEKEKQQLMQPYNILRIASVSKLITATGIMRLCEMGKLRLTDHVFGPHAVLNDTAYTNVITDKRYFNITIEDLLRHKAGFTRAAGDPVFSTRYIMMQNHLSTPPDHRTLLRIVLKRRLGYEPGGDMQKYCNIGYLLLSMVIEKCSGQPYEQFIQRQLLYPAGCFGFKIAGNYYNNRHPNEVKYYMHKEAEPIYEYNNSGRMVVKCYGENDITSSAGAGAWCASAAELCHFVSAIDGDKHYPDILSETSVKTMTEDKGEHHFSIGWNFTPKGKPWTRTGTLSGSSALVVRYPDTHQCWVLITNTSSWKGQGFAKDTMALFEKLRKEFGMKMKPLQVEFIQ